MDEDVLCPVAAITFLLSICVSMGIGGCIATSQMRSEAVKAGVAEWRLSNKEGDVKFHWRVQPEETGQGY